MALDTIATARLEIAKIYIAAFNRVPDAAGLSNWLNQYTAGLMTYSQISENFTQQAEYITAYPAVLTNAEYVDRIYVNVFGRAADAAGKANWVSQLDGNALTRGTIMKSMLNSAADVGNTDGLRLTNQATFGVQSILDNVPTATATAQLANITSVASTVTTATAAVSASANAGTTYALTTAVDTFTGAALNDTFTATVGATGANATDTLNASDDIKGGAGTDTMNLTVTAANTAALQGALISGIEVLNVRAGAATVVNASTAVGLTSVIADRGVGTLLVNNLATGASITVNGNGTAVQGEVAFAPATAASAITLNFTNGVAQAAGDSVTAAATIGAGNATGTATTATINSTGAANVSDVVDLANATLTSVTINAATNLTADMLSQGTDQVAATGTVTVSGAATLVTFTAALDNDIATINAAGMTAGGISATLGSLVTQTVTGGAGADTITTGAVLTTGSVNAGAGTDTLVVAAGGTHLATAALGAKYTNFETLRVNDSQDMSVISGITAVEANAMNTKAITNMTATQAAAVKVLGTQTTSLTLALAAATGTSDVATITTGTGLLATEAFDLGTLVVTGFETLNVNANAGATATAADKSSLIAAFTGATLNTVNLTGSAFVITNATTIVASTINASALTGDGATTTLGLTIGSTTFVAGSTVTGSNYVDNVTIAGGTEGITLNLGTGNDLVTANIASLVADATNDGAINGGTGTDVLTVTDTTVTMTDNHFTKLSNMETLTLTNSAGDASVTTGTAFNTAFASGATITSGTMAAAKDFTLNAGLATVAVTVTVDATTNAVVLTAAENNVITTGSGADVITFTGDAQTVGVAGAGGSIVISSGAGNDTIAVTVGTMLAQTTTNFLDITGGTGADTITKVGVNCTTVESTANFIVAAGDSTATAYDKITGFDAADGTNLSDVLDFTGTSAVGTLATTIDSGVILSHTITAGVAKFDDAASYAAELIINSTNLADVVAYLAANTATLDTVAFAYDSDNNGANDATMVFNNGTTDSLVQLTGVTGVASLNATATTATANCVVIA
ncbi:MAG: DUF4214 domain-containing protein [Sulfurimonas sp.]|jgi:hypothetical protein